ncbi:hypothetical protein WN51_00861 [Melipona quadrifasciata]|uniref:Uncharacterized protein n=1 Tax=Melipona quadrifasciata TaxID=166423 RepID=A0A0M9ADB7_9HYME|nr:hypothetical protein WN51_00861 [Melipona quadrifasciata]
MKHLGSISKEKFISLEEGLVPEARIFTQGARSTSNNKGCKRMTQCMKIILYLLFVGLAGYAMWQTFSINIMEFKVIDSIRKSQSEDLFGQRSTFDKSVGDTPGQFHQLKDISTTEASSDLDSKTSFTNETDKDESPNATDVMLVTDLDSKTSFTNETDKDESLSARIDEVLPVTTESYDINKIRTTSTTTDESPIESVESNSSLGQQINERFYDKYDDDYLVSDEMKLERDQEELLENYALLSLIIQNAVRTSHIIDSFGYYDNGDIWGYSAPLNEQNSNGVDEENGQGTRETQETQETQETLNLFMNAGDYEEENSENSENSDYQVETVPESSVEDYYGHFYG